MVLFHYLCCATHGAPYLDGSSGMMAMGLYQCTCCATAYVAPQLLTSCAGVPGWMKQLVTMYRTIDDIYGLLTDRVQPELLGATQGGAADASTKKTPSKLRAHRRAGGSSVYKCVWAKGTGYGGGSHYGGAQTSEKDAERRLAAQQMQQLVDACLRQRLEQLHAQLSELLAGSNPLPLATECVLHRGPLTACLKLLLQRHSIVDMASSGTLYTRLLELLRLAGTHMALIPLLLASAEYKSVAEETTSQPGTDQGPSSSTSTAVQATAAESSATVLQALHKLSQQCAVFKRTMQHGRVCFVHQRSNVPVYSHTM